MQRNFAKYPEHVELYHLLFAMLFDAQKIKDLNQLRASLDPNTRLELRLRARLLLQINPELVLMIVETSS
jgi:hypothetical protein